MKRERNLIQEYFSDASQKDLKFPILYHLMVPNDEPVTTGNRSSAPSKRIPSTFYRTTYTESYKFFKPISKLVK